MELPKPYRLADKTISLLNRKAISRFGKVRGILLISDFDELSVIRNMEMLYKQLNQDNEDAFRDLYRTRYRELYLYLKRSWPEDDVVDDLAEIYLANLLTEPNELTRYAYDSEVLRKRDRAAESINAAGSKGEKREELDKALRYWSRQTGFYVDIISDGAAWQSIKDCGIKHVRWHTQHDERVCVACDSRDGKVYDIDNIPEKEHLSCRCWIEPIK